LSADGARTSPSASSRAGTAAARKHGRGQQNAGTASRPDCERIECVRG
jgi:hypothetical protein